jgi:hypothetical protein
LEKLFKLYSDSKEEIKGHILDVYSYFNYNLIADPKEFLIKNGLFETYFEIIKNEKNKNILFICIKGIIKLIKIIFLKKLKKRY